MLTILGSLAFNAGVKALGSTATFQNQKQRWTKLTHYHSMHLSNSGVFEGTEINICSHNFEKLGKHTSTNIVHKQCFECHVEKKHIAWCNPTAGSTEKSQKERKSWTILTHHHSVQESWRAQRLQKLAPVDFRVLNFDTIVLRFGTRF